MQSQGRYQKPVIYDLSPVDGTRIGNNNNSVTVAASDNAKLSNLKIEYKINGLFSSYQTIKEIAGNSKNNCTATVALPLDELNSGTEVTIKVTASDSSGNQADEKIATYTIDKDAPEIKDVKLVEKDIISSTLHGLVMQMIFLTSIYIESVQMTSHMCFTIP